MILHNWVFENFILANEPFIKAFEISVACASVNNDLFGNFALSLDFQIKFD